MKNKPAIVIVDDDENAIELLEYNFSKYGFFTICFSDSLIAIKFLMSNKVDMIVTDWMMPGKNGLELINSLENSINKETKKFMVSCISDEKSIKKALNSGVVRYVAKPIKIANFIEEVKLCLQA